MALLCLGSFYMNGQNTLELSGLVQDENTEALISATVVMLSEKDSTIVSFGLTDSDGKFEIIDLHPQKYILQITYLGYNQYVQDLELNESTNLGKIALKQQANALEDIEITAEHTPIQIKKDTIEYNAAAFQTQPHEVVEDLLRKLPGVEVEADGTIIAQGEEVQEVLVDGKEFFGNDVKIATKNLPADAIKKVQVFDKRSDMAEFSGIDDGERSKTINLQLKEDHKNGSFGSLTAGYGNHDRYSGRLSLNKFSSRLQASLIGNFNNINEQGFSVDEYISFMGGMGGLFGRGGRGTDVPVSDGLSNGFVVSNAGGLNLNYDLTEKTKLSFNYFLNNIENDLLSEITREYTEDITDFTFDSSDQQTNSDSHRINVEIESEIDSTSDIKTNGSFTFNNGGLNSFNSSTAFNVTGDQDYINTTSLNSDADNFKWSGRTTYRRKMGKSQNKIFTLGLNLNQSFDDSEGDLEALNSFFQTNTTGGTTTIVENLLQNQIQADDQTDYRIQASFVQPMSHNKFLEIFYERRNYDNEFLRDVTDLLLNQNDKELSTEYERNYFYDQYGLSYSVNSDKSQLTLEGAVQQSHLNGDIISDSLLIENSVFRFLPSLNWRYEIGQAHNIRTRYSTNVREPSLTQLQPLLDNTDPNNLYQGNPDLIPEYRHSLRLNYMKYDQFSFSSFFAFINSTYTRNKITNRTIRSERGQRTTTPVNVDYDFNVAGTVNYGTPIRKLKTKINLRNRISYSNSILFVSGFEDNLPVSNQFTTDRYNGNVRLSMENRKKDIIDWNIGGSWSYNIIKYRGNTDNNQNYFDQNLFADFNYNIKNTFSFKTGIDVQFYSAQSGLDNLTVPIWKASVSTYILKNKGQIKFSAFDLLNQNLGVSRSNTLNYIENSETLSIGRYFMLSFSYALKGFKKTKGSSGRPMRFR